MRPSFRSMFLVVGLITTALATGCATMPVTGAPATGEELAVMTGIAHYNETVREKVGEVEHRDEYGNSLGTSEVYADREVTHSVMVWNTAQGQSRLDEEDFFRIAGDTRMADSIHSQREMGVLVNRGGWGVAVLGGGVALGGYAMRTNQSLETLGTYAVLGGTLTALAGGALVYMGLNMVDPDRHFASVDEASFAANRYNATLAVGSYPAPTLADAPKAARVVADAPTNAPDLVPASAHKAKKRH